ncbi:hypothetical protein RRG08_055042 [Elysia crispata]|uniref:Uncharacterized protein n=1 Tax=Elysia crispata TaxID=231223 RepID=A0AAE1AZV8_9GAST|nr:hypothetical protein RRG08_055042 [Elysia crispata]
MTTSDTQQTRSYKNRETPRRKTKPSENEVFTRSDDRANQIKRGTGPEGKILMAMRKATLLRMRSPLTAVKLETMCNLARFYWQRRQENFSQRTKVAVEYKTHSSSHSSPGQASGRIKQCQRPLSFLSGCISSGDEVCHSSDEPNPTGLKVPVTYTATWYQLEIHGLPQFWLTKPYRIKVPVTYTATWQIDQCGRRYMISHSSGQPNPTGLKVPVTYTATWYQLEIHGLPQFWLTKPYRIKVPVTVTWYQLEIHGLPQFWLTKPYRIKVPVTYTATWYQLEIPGLPQLWLTKPYRIKLSVT